MVERYVPRGPKDVTLQQRNRRRIKELERALMRAVNEHGHKYNCSAARGMERDCHCGWLEVRELVKSFTPQHSEGQK